ncbi:alcohol dehydrogenase catalytic domain-containing protein [Gordonia terrae]
MKAWIFTEVGAPLEMVDLPDPEPGPDEVVVDVKAAGLCHSDVGFSDGTMTGILGFTPIVLGHEAAGVVSAVGSGVTDVRVGDRVAVSAMGDGKSGVVGQKNIGVGRHGAFAQKTLSPASEILPIADTVSFEQGAAATDAGMTSYHAVFVRGGLNPGTRVGIIGLGGLGMTAARMAVLGGGEVYAAEKNTDIHDQGLERGVKAVVDDVRDLADYSLDLIVDFAGFGTTTAGAIEVINDGGRIVQVGMGLAEATISTQLLTLKQLDILGSLGGGPEDTVEVLKFIAAGDLEIAASPIEFSRIPEGLEILEQGQAGGRRLVAVLE